MWLGSFVLMLWGLNSFQQNFARAFSGIQRSILEKGFSSSMATLFLQSAAVTATEASPLRSLYTSMAMLNLRILDARPAVLMMCLSPFALIPVFLLGLLYLNFSGFFILGLCVVALLRFGKPNYLDDALKVLFSVGVFLIAGESVLKSSSIIQTYLTQNDLVFFLADGRFSAVLVLVALSFVVSLLVQTEFWSLALALSLLTSGMLSFNGALGVLLGERLAMAMIFWYRTRSLSLDCQRLGRQYAILAFISSVIGFWIAGETRVFLNVGFSSDVSAVQEKTFSLLVLFGVMLAVQWFAGMIWGHFAGNKQNDEMQDAKYITAAWIYRGLLAEGPRDWAKDKVHKRLSEIRYHLAGMHSLKEGQLPAHIQARIKDEEHQLSNLHL
ncbi:hypothetical protein AZI86_09265 [Bdellovibrio bacteriovorus]|uniref:Uncharacterized protein n=2 Tax=Bdellovibrio bacteriovorus TaxID=959 RepID=A0A150WS40_BDEBC|nr:hypothetical protein AZI86_09265 [Bdellovibrio bacteriovorus]